VAARLVSFGGPRLLLAPALRLVFALIHPSAWNRFSRKFTSTIQYIAGPIPPNRPLHRRPPRPGYIALLTAVDRYAQWWMPSHLRVRPNPYLTCEHHRCSPAADRSILAPTTVSFWGVARRLALWHASPSAAPVGRRGSALGRASGQWSARSGAIAVHPKGVTIQI
jgi:hypothetical protein